MRKKMKIVIGVILGCVLVLLVLWKCGIIFKESNPIFEEQKTQEENKPKDEIKDNTEIIKEEHLEKEENGEIKDKDSGSVVYDPNQDIEDIPIQTEPIRAPEKIEEGYITEYLKYFFFVYPEQSFTSFTEKQIATIVALSSELWMPRKESEVQKIAKQYFKKDNYELPVGTYKLENYGEFSVSKENGYYVRSDIKGFKMSENSAFLDDTIIKDNKVTLKYIYAKNGLNGEGYTKLDPNEKYIKGYYTINLTYTGEGYNIDSIEYKINKN